MRHSLSKITLRFEGFHGYSIKMPNRFVVATCNFSFVSMCGSEKKQGNLTFQTVYSVCFQETAGF